jgi:hypothetical protein
MSDYLNSLVTRALQLGPVVQPRLASLFEPQSRAAEPDAAPFEVQSMYRDSAITESPFESATSQLSTQPRHQALPAIAPATGTPIREQEINTGFEHGSKQPGTPSPQPPPLVPSASIVAPVLPQSPFLQPDSERAYRLDHEEAAPRSPETVRKSLSDPDIFQPRARGTENYETRPRIEPEIRQVSAADQPAESTFQPKQRGNQVAVNAAITVPVSTTREVSAQASEPTSVPETVVVTIGRVDVRPVFTQPPMAPRSNRPQQPGPMSLDEYLKQRSEGRR